MLKKRFALLFAGLLALECFGCALADSPAVAADQNSAYEMQVFTAQPDISITYPNFTANDALNALVKAEVQSLVPEDPTGVTIDYDCAVTLLNHRFASMVFWGYSDVEGSVHPYDNLATLNVDLTTMQPVTLENLYNTDADFEKLFIAKASFPSDPVTSYSPDMFAEMLAMQVDSFTSFNPFSMPGQVLCFLKPDGLVLSMSAIHATGCDHFEAQLNYSDIQPFYLPAQNVWED